MFVSDCLGVNAQGHLTIGGKDTVELAQVFATPLYVMDEETIRRQCRVFRKAVEGFFGRGSMVLYAAKAFCCKAMCRIVMEEGLGLDVVSGSELYTAVSSGFPVENIYFHGNNKTMDELRYAVQSGVGHIVVDHSHEMEALEQIAQSTRNSVRILLRVKPGVEAHTHEYVQTGGIDSKFGFALETGEAFEAVKKAHAMQYLQFEGLHCHIGSQILEIEPYQLAAQRMVELMAQIKDELKIDTHQLNLGGGFGIRYLAQETAPDYRQWMIALSETVRGACEQHRLVRPRVLIEPGRAIAGPAGITLYKVGDVKEIPDVRTYVSVDGGMADNPRYPLYGASYDMVIANKAAKQKDQVYTVAGRCCESGDLLGKNVLLQTPQAGDLLAVCSTGAYNYSMSSHYNRLPKPPVILVRGKEARVVVRRETYEDVVRNDV